MWMESGSAALIVTAVPVIGAVIAFFVKSRKRKDDVQTPAEMKVVLRYIQM